jgi:predicted small secreted protein
MNYAFFSDRQKGGIIMKNLLMALVLLGMVLLVASCNMLRGAGQDIESVGDSIKDAAN